MVETEWFRLRRDRDASDIKGGRDFSRKRYPYFVDKEAFDALEDGTAFYEYTGQGEQEDFLFDPTFLIGDRFQTIFHYLEPDMEFKAVHLIDERRKEDAPAPLYWVPFLPYEEVVHETSEVVLGKAEKLVLRRDALGERRILHARLPADDIWLFSLEAAECILRRAPMGAWMTRIEEYR